MRKKHILVISQYFYPEQFRINDICTEWIKRGYKVTVLTGIPNYPQGEFYSGYGLHKKREEKWNGIRIIRIPIISRGNNSIRLALNYASFVISGFFWKILNDVKADYVFTYEVSPMTQALIGVWYSKAKHIPHYVYVTDLWPENVEVITGIHNRLILDRIQSMSDYIYRNSTKILTSSRSFIRAISKRNISRNQLEYWPQYAEDFYKPLSSTDKTEIPQDGILNIVFAGNIGYAQGLGILVDVAAKLKSDGVNVRFVLIGDGRYLPELKEKVNSMAVNEFFLFIDRKPAEEIPKYLANADVALISLSKSKVFSITIPAKTQSCMACGTPLLVSADGEVQKIVKEANAGLVSNAEDVEGLYTNILTLSKMPKAELFKFGANALEYSKQHFEKRKLLDRIDQIFNEGE